MGEADIVWAAVLIAGLGYEVAALRNNRKDDTLSETTRRWFMTNKPAGRWAFGVAWVGFSAWYLWHILW